MKKLITTFILFFMICLPAYSDVQHITLDEAVSLALEHNLDLKSKQKQAEELEQDIKLQTLLKTHNSNLIFLWAK